MVAILIRLLPCLALFFAAGCSSFEHRFAEAAQSPPKREHFAGAYAGKWASAQHPGGGGNLRCILSRLNDSDYVADFHATWHGFSSEHSVVLHTVPVGKKSGSPAAKFEGTSKLRTPIGAGTYACKGTVDSRQMQACYDATYDRGTFEMSRVITRAASR